MVLINVIILITILIKESLTKDIYSRYCDRPCGDKEHTVCKRANVKCGPGPGCGRVVSDPYMTNEFRQKILDLHNELRSKVALGAETTGSQPSASNMNVLNYNYEMEHIAQCLANTCDFNHDQCRIGMELKAGQNLAISSRSNSDGMMKVDVCLTLIRGWYDEVKDLDVSEIDSFKGGEKGTGHYTQMVWADIEYIGCGRIVWAGKNGWYSVYLVCNYGGVKTGGNLLGAPMYGKGPPASACPAEKKPSAHYQGLCGEAKSVDEIDPGDYGRAMPNNTEPRKSILAIITVAICYVLKKLFI